MSDKYIPFDVLMPLENGSYLIAVLRKRSDGSIDQRFQPFFRVGLFEKKHSHRNRFSFFWPLNGSSIQIVKQRDPYFSIFWREIPDFSIETDIESRERERIQQEFYNDQILYSS